VATALSSSFPVGQAGLWTELLMLVLIIGGPPGAANDQQRHARH
jgi:hypothetical protein